MERQIYIPRTTVLVVVAATSTVVGLLCMFVADLLSEAMTIAAASTMPQAAPPALALLAAAAALRLWLGGGKEANARDTWRGSGGGGGGGNANYGSSSSAAASSAAIVAYGTWATDWPLDVEGRVWHFLPLRDLAAAECTSRGFRQSVREAGVWRFWAERCFATASSDTSYIVKGIGVMDATTLFDEDATERRAQVSLCSWQLTRPRTKGPRAQPRHRTLTFATVHHRPPPIHPPTARRFSCGARSPRR